MELFAPAEQKLDPYPFYAERRRTAPVVYSEESAAWGLYRYDDVKRVLSDPATFSSDLGARLQGRQRRASLISLDPPRHRSMRNLVSTAFTPRAVQALAPRIEAIANSLIDKVAGHGQMELVQDLAYPLPVTVIAEMLGVSAEDLPRFKAWADRLLVVPRAFASAAVDEDRERVLAEMDTYFTDVIAARRADPQDDLISALLVAEVEGERLSQPEILGFCTLLLLAGHVTTVNLVTNAMLTLMEQPEALAELRSHPEAIPGAIEETLRFRSPVQFVSRRTLTEVELSGCRIPAGELLLPFIGSANHDETVFAQPERFDLRRHPNPHMAFGYGIHFCLGAPLARLEGAIALRLLLERLPRLMIAPLDRDQVASMTQQPLEPIESVLLHGISRLPLRFEASTRRL